MIGDLTERSQKLFADLTIPFDNMQDWRTFASENSFVSSAIYIGQTPYHAMTFGVKSGFWGYVPPSNVEVISPNYREHLLVNGLNSRCRAILELIAAESSLSDASTAKIYAAEGITQFALTLRGRYPRFLGSEYAADAEKETKLFPIPMQDLTALDFPDCAFDCAITNDCLEHIANVGLALRELRRIVRDGGVMLATFPFTFQQASVIKAREVDGQIEYLAEPEYHGNPVDPAAGSLVYRIPGWDILDDAREAGFSKAEMVFVGGPERAIVTAEVSGVFVLRCYR